MKQSKTIAGTVKLAPLPPPQPSGIVASFPLSTAHPNWPDYANAVTNTLNGQAAGMYTSDLLMFWAATGRTNNAIRDYVVKGWKSNIANWTAAIAAGQDLTTFSRDNYLDVGLQVRAGSMVLNWLGDRFTDTERTQLAAVLDQAVYNAWNPTLAKWGTTPHPWGPWAQDNPGNNYYYSFLEALLNWAVASGSQTWLDFIHNKIFPQMRTYFAKLVGGGDREGTGYGKWHRRLFWALWCWKQATGEDLSADMRIEDHLNYWCWCLTPDLKSYVPIGDQAGSGGSYPTVDDYYKGILLYGSLLVPNSTAAAIARGILAKLSPKLINSYAYLWGCVLPNGQTAPIVGTSYLSPGIGHLFLNGPNGERVSLVSGNSYESHAHFDQGAFGLYAKGKWQLTMASAFGGGGLWQETAYQCCPLFYNADGSIILQKRTSAMNGLSYTESGGVVDAIADTSVCYQGTNVSNVKRRLVVDWANRKLTTTDTFTLANNATAVWCAGTNEAPTANADGSLTTATGITVRSLTLGTVAKAQDMKASYPDSFKSPCWMIYIRGAKTYTVEVSW